MLLPRRLLLSLAGFALILSTSSARAADATIKDFEAREQKDEYGNVLQYRLFKPAGYDPAKKYPVILFLHGAGERGGDNTKQVRDALHFTKESVQKDHPAFVIAPQCPGERLAFQVWGSGKVFDQTYNDYEKSASTWKSYSIQLSKLPAGPKTRLYLINQPERKPPNDAAGGAPASSTFRNVRIHESVKGEKVNPPAPIDFRKSSLDIKQGKGKIEVSEDGAAITLTADMKLKIPFEYTVTKDTVLEFEFMSASRGSAHAVSLDTDDQLDFRWVQVEWGGKTHTMPKQPSIPMKLAMASLDQVRKEFSIDEKRIYITGLSMGGYGTWDAIARYPGLFAAAVPVCGGADELTAPQVKDLPIWCFHGGADTTVPTQRSRNMIEALKKAGGSPKYTEFPGVGHNSWDKAYSTAEMIQWLFEQKNP